MKLTVKFLLISLIALPCILSFAEPGRVFARAEDPIEDDVDDEDEAQVEGGGDIEATEEEGTPEEDTGPKSQGSPDVDVTILFTKPEGNGMELPAGKGVEFLLGVTNNGDHEFIIDAAEASFRYPMDFTYYIQNFSVAAYNKVVKPHHEATVMYSFYPAEVFAGRPLGLQINLAYHDSEGADFTEAVFNSTVTIVEVDEGLDGETFFLYVFLLAFAVLLLLVGHTVLSSLGVGGSKKAVAKKQQHASHVEVGTSNKNGVDYDWLPDQLKADLMRKAAAAASNPGKKSSQASNGAPASNKGAVASVARTPATRSSPRLRKI